MYWNRVVVLSVLATVSAVRRIDGDGPFIQNSGPSIRDLLNSPVEVVEGSDALLTCIVRNIGENTVFWSKIDGGKRSILTVDKLIISKDNRFLVLHDGSGTDSAFIRDGGDVWVLAIRNVTQNDTGSYSCRVNSSPAVQTLFTLNVKTNETMQSDIELRSTHNYTRCCQLAGVSTKCLGYCSIHTLLEGNVGAKEEECEEHLGEVVRCMADQRNHVPCCKREGVPDICLELCRGQYTPQDDYIKSHFSCADYLESTLMCISEGIDLLPLPPVNPVVKVSGSTTLNISWSHPHLAPSMPDKYVVTITPIKSFDPPEDYTLARSNNTTHALSGIQIQRYVTKVPVNITQFVQMYLKPLTWYEIEVTSENKHGASLPPYTLRALTRPPYEPPKIEAKTLQLPDVVGCCISKGVTQERCLTNLCNPHNTMLDEPDMIVCAPWATEVFSCLAGNYDHSPCCRERNLPDVCVELCTGEVTRIDYRTFRCLDYFSDYRSCLFKGYGVLPSPPRRVRVSNIFDTTALLSWSPPLNNSNSVTSYHSYFRPINASRSCLESWDNDVGSSSYKGIYSPQSPFVLESLCPDTEYEVYIQAFNSHGTSDPSVRVLFRTLAVEDILENKDEYSYNITACCENVLVSPGCMPLCSYDARMSHFTTLSKNCAAEISRILRCGVGGRNHGTCCSRRGVPDGCQPICTGTYVPDEAVQNKCHLYIGNIVLCLEDGVGLIPGPVHYLHITSVTKEGVTLSWEPPSEGANVTMFQVHYQSTSNSSASPVQYELDNVLNSTKTVAVVKNLQPNLLYKFFVVATNQNGASLPSSALHLNVSDYLEQIAAGKRDPSHPLAAVPSSPHSLRLESKTTTSLTILWETPELALPTDRFQYKIYYTRFLSNFTVVRKNDSDSKTVEVPPPDAELVSDIKKADDSVESLNGMAYRTKTTSVTALKLDSLKPNTRYIIWITATNDMGESRPSETLFAWTDPAYPAFVETPTVHPTSLVVEGSSVTVLCIAMGSPPPTVSLYISGILVHQDVTRHMVTVVKNITRNMTDISCYADNGYGAPMQRSITITISRPPRINAPDVVHTTLGRSSTLRCEVDAWPKPSLIWWRDPDGRVPIIHGGNYEIRDYEDEQSGALIMEAKIKTVNASDEGELYCFARNAFGTSIHKIKLIASPPISRPPEVTACCKASNMSETCLEACEFDEITIGKVLNNEQCLPQFDELIKCAADNSDHRSCCSLRGVPDSCLDWCRQEPVSDRKHCLLVWAPAIFACFQEGKELLPGPPINVRVTSNSNSTALVQWVKPNKNSEKVELYRVFWRVLGQSASNTKDTADTELTITGLVSGLSYEIAVKAGNQKGTSVLTDTITYRHGVTSYVSSASLHSHDNIGIAVGVVLAVLILIGGVSVAIWWKWRGKMVHSGSQGGISFQNPSYITGQAGDTVQIAETPNGSLNGTIASELNRGGSLSGSSFDSAGSIGLNGDCIPNGGVWSTQQGPDTPGFEEDLKNNRKYSRFGS